MKLIIDIPDDIQNTIESDEFISREQLAVLQMHILNGIPLDKIRDEIDEQIKLYNKESDDFGIVYGLKFAQTIISNYTKGDTNE